MNENSAVAAGKGRLAVTSSIGPDLVGGYLGLLGSGRPLSPDLRTLTALHHAHLQRVPFENLDVADATDAKLDATTLVERIVRRGRGGMCYELNGAFAQLLSAIGFRVELVPAQVCREGSLGEPFGHMALRVWAPQPVLVDVGFGEEGLTPVEWGSAPGNRQTCQMWRYGDCGWEVRNAGVACYVIGDHAARLADFEAMYWWHRHSPESRFTRSVICSRSEGTGRITVSGNRLIRTSVNGRSEQLLTDDEVLAAYRTHFGIELSQLPRARYRTTQA